MPIRREDREFIQALSLIGAVFGACIGVFLVMHLSERARQTYAEQSEYTQTQAALVKLKSTVVNPGNPIADENVLNQVQKHIEQTPDVEPVAKQNFWVQNSRIGHIALCTGGCIAGAVIGFSSVWLSGWIGAFTVLYTIRLLYKAIRSVAPNSVAAKCTAYSVQPENNTAGYYQRDDGRILPVLVKLFFLLVVILAILSAVVWHLTAL